jgi:hypothetical protein
MRLTRRSRPRYFIETGRRVKAVVLTRRMRLLAQRSASRRASTESAAMTMSFDSRGSSVGATAKSESR